MVLNTVPLDWDSSALTTKALLHDVTINLYSHLNKTFKPGTQLVGRRGSFLFPLQNIAWKVSRYVVSPISYFPVFSPYNGKYGPERTPYLDIFHVVKDASKLSGQILT